MEVDAYVFSKIAENAGHLKAININPSNQTAGTSGPGNPLFELNAGFLALAEAEVPESDQIIFCSNAFYNDLRNTNEIVKTMRQTEYGENVKFTIGEYEGREIIAVPANRFKTLIKLLNGGYGWKQGSKKINFIVCAKSAITHVTKYDKVRVFNPGVVQDFDGYKVNIRVYHDVFVPVNKRPAIYCCTEAESGALAADASERELTAVITVAAKKPTLVDAVVKPNGDLVKGVILTTSTLAIDAAVPSDAVYLTKGVEGAALANGTYHVYGVENGKVVTAAAKNLAGTSADITIS